MELGQHLTSEERKILKREPDKITVIIPENTEYVGEDDAVITNVQGFYIPIFLHSSVGGLVHAVQSTLANKMNKGMVVFEEFKKKYDAKK